jgi:hypothetical protein
VLHKPLFASFHVITKGKVNILTAVPRISPKNPRFTLGKDGDMATIAIGDSVLEFLFRRLFLFRNVKIKKL